MDFRDHFIRKALDKAVGPYRPEKTRRSRLARIATIAALALVVSVAFVIVVNHSAPRPPPPERKPVSVEILPAPAKR